MGNPTVRGIGWVCMVAAVVLIAVGLVAINNAQLEPLSQQTGNEGALPIIGGLIVGLLGIVLVVTNRKRSG